VFDDIAHHGVDEVWCLGDLVGGGPDPAAVIDAVRALPLVLGGNHDAWLAQGTMWPEERATLNQDRLAWLAQLHPEDAAITSTAGTALRRDRWTAS
jgi:hypothetical protein